MPPIVRVYCRSWWGISILLIWERSWISRGLPYVRAIIVHSRSWTYTVYRVRCGPRWRFTIRRRRSTGWWQGSGRESACWDKRKSMTIKEQQDEIIADFELFGDWMD